MDKETASYIITYFPNLLTENEKIALRHILSLEKLKNTDPGAPIVNMYKKNGWLTDIPEALALIKNGYNYFEMNVVQRILQEHKNEIFLNFCPSCGKLARTPIAKQCRYCQHDWHKK